MTDDYCIIIIILGILGGGDRVLHIRGYHVYHQIWHPIIGEVLGTTHKWENEHDRYTVAVLEEETCVVGHLPRLINRVLLLFDNGRDNHCGGNRMTTVFRPHRWRLRYPDCRRSRYDFMTRLNCASQILIMRQPAPRGNIN